MEAMYVNLGQEHKHKIHGKVGHLKFTLNFVFTDEDECVE